MENRMVLGSIQMGKARFGKEHGKMAEKASKKANDTILQNF